MRLVNCLGLWRAISRLPGAMGRCQRGKLVSRSCRFAGWPGVHGFTSETPCHLAAGWAPNTNPPAPAANSTHRYQHPSFDSSRLPPSRSSSHAKPSCPSANGWMRPAARSHIPARSDHAYAPSGCWTNPRSRPSTVNAMTKPPSGLIQGCSSNIQRSIFPSASPRHTASNCSASSAVKSYSRTNGAPSNALDRNSTFMAELLTDIRRQMPREIAFTSRAAQREARWLQFPHQTPGRRSSLSPALQGLDSDSRCKTLPVWSRPREPVL